MSLKNIPFISMIMIPACSFHSADVPPAFPVFLPSVGQPSLCPFGSEMASASSCDAIAVSITPDLGSPSSTRVSADPMSAEEMSNPNPLSPSQRWKKCVLTEELARYNTRIKDLSAKLITKEVEAGSKNLEIEGLKRELAAKSLEAKQSREESERLKKELTKKEKAALEIADYRQKIAQKEASLLEEKCRLAEEVVMWNEFLKKGIELGEKRQELAKQMVKFGQDRDRLQKEIELLQKKQTSLLEEWGKLLKERSKQLERPTLPRTGSRINITNIEERSKLAEDYQGFSGQSKRFSEEWKKLLDEYNKLQEQNNKLQEEWNILLEKWNILAEEDGGFLHERAKFFEQKRKFVETNKDGECESCKEEGWLEIVKAENTSITAELPSESKGSEGRWD